jgi:1-acyl-sn-glycerol-3-phosphate acyltransferase
MRNKKITKVKKDQVKHFDFAKKPKTPCFLIPFVTKCICQPIINSRGFKLEKSNMDSLGDEPYLLFSNHSSFVDFMIMLSVTYPKRPNNVMS